MVIWAAVVNDIDRESSLRNGWVVSTKNICRWAEVGKEESKVVSAKER